MLAPSCLLLALSSAAHAAPGSAEWTQADVLHLRAAPAAGAASKARLPYGTWVRVEEERGGWARVTVGDRPREAELTGWLDSSFLAPTLPSRDQLLSAAQEAKAPGDAVKPLTRALALDPGDADAIELLEQVAAQLGDAALANRAARLAAGSDPVYLGACLGGRVVVHSTIVPGTGALKPVAGRGGSDPGAAELLATLGAQLGGVSWFAHGGEASRVPPGRFAAPFVDAEWNGGGGAWGVDDPEELDFSAAVLVLGGCDDEGGVYATTPLTRLPEAHVPPTLAAKALAGLAELDDGASTGIALASWEGLPFLEVRVTMPYVFHDCGGEEYGPEPVQTEWLVDEAGRVVRRWGADLAPETPETLPFSTYAPAAWMAVDLPDTSVVFSVGNGESAMSAGVSVQAFPGGKPGRPLHTALRSSGC